MLHTSVYTNACLLRKSSLFFKMIQKTVLAVNGFFFDMLVKIFATHSELQVGNNWRKDLLVHPLLVYWRQSYGKQDEKEGFYH